MTALVGVCREPGCENPAPVEENLWLGEPPDYLFPRHCARCSEWVAVELFRVLFEAAPDPLREALLVRELAAAWRELERLRAQVGS